jgi:tetratricopeptide (TPR) repeat protein
MCFTAQSKAEKWISTKTLFDDIIKNYPADIAYAHAYSVRGDWFKENGFNKEAEKDVMLALYFSKEAKLSVFALAGLLKDKGNYDEALKLYESLPEDDVNITKAYVHAANIYYEQKNNAEKAHEAVNKGLKYFPEDFFLNITLGSFYVFEEKYDKAEERFMKAKKIFPENKQSYTHLADMYEKTGRKELARRQYLEAIEKNGPDKQLLDKLGKLYFESGSYEQAEKTFSRAASLYPGDYEAYDYLGNIYAIKRDYKKAFYYFTLAILINRSYAPAYFHRAAVHLETGRYEKAAEDAETVKKLGASLLDEFKNEMKQKSGIIL